MAASLEHTLHITKAVNHLFGPPVAAALEWLNAHGVPLPYDPELPIPDNLVVTWLIMIVVGALAFRGGRKLKEYPEGGQHVWELFGLVIFRFLDDVIGRENGRKFFAMIGTLAMFILLANLSGIVPFLKAPTSNLNVTLGCAIIAFLYYHYQGIRLLGLKQYAAHFAGPNPLIAPIMVPIEFISHISRVLSLSVRLFGNIMGEDVVIIILFMLSPIGAPLPMMAFALFTSTLQTFIFCMLTMMYLAGAVGSGHEEH